MPEISEEIHQPVCESLADYLWILDEEWILCDRVDAMAATSPTFWKTRVSYSFHQFAFWGKHWHTPRLNLRSVFGASYPKIRRRHSAATGKRKFEKCCDGFGPRTIAMKWSQTWRRRLWAGCYPRNLLNRCCKVQVLVHWLTGWPLAFHFWLGKKGLVGSRCSLTLPH